MKVKMGNFDSMEWLGGRCRGAYLVRLNKHQVLYHCVLLNGSCRVVI